METIKAQKFNSLIEFSDYLKNTPANCLSGQSVKKVSKRDNFYKTTSFTQANMLMLNGWDSGTAKVTEIMNIQAAGVESVKRLMLDVVGVIPCAPAYLSGSPRNMINIKRRNVSKPVLRLLYCTGALGSVSADTIIKAGATMFNTILGIESAGVRVELWAGTVSYEWSSNGLELVGNFVKIKSADQPINVMQMTYPIIHPSFQRRHSFAFRERQNLDNNTWDCYGSTCNNIEEIRKCADFTGLSVDHILTVNSIRGKSEKEIADMIK